MRATSSAVAALYRVLASSTSLTNTGTKACLCNAPLPHAHAVAAQHCSSTYLKPHSATQPGQPGGTLSSACRHTSNSSSNGTPEFHTSSRDDDDASIANLDDIADHARQLVHDPARMLMSAVGVPMAVLMRTNSAQLADLQLLEHQKHVMHQRRRASAFGDHSTSTPLAAQQAADMQDAAQRLDALTATWHQEQDQALQTVPEDESISEQVKNILQDISNPQQAQSQLRHLLQKSLHMSQDSWGTTRESPADIARRLVESNEGTGGDGDGGQEGSGGDEDGDEELKLTEAEAAAATVEDIQKDLKQLDEIFEVLAEVPWLDESDLEQREKKGIVSVALLGTLEEAGWDLRTGVERIWGGERDQEVVAAGAGERESAALMSILFHTARLEEQFGKPEQPWQQATDFGKLRLKDAGEDQEAAAKIAKAEKQAQEKKPPLSNRKNG